MATVTHKVVRGDTLSHIAIKYKTTVNSIVKLNNIKNPNLIYVGQVLYISGKPSTGGSSGGGTTTPPSNTVSFTAFGLQADTDRSIFAIWKWDKKNTENYEVEWSYYVSKNKQWFSGNKSTSDIKESIYSAPANADTVRIRVKPISETYTKNDKEVHYWTADWSPYKTYNMSDLPPKVPTTPTVEVKDYTLTAKIDNLDVNGNEIEFEIVKNDSTVFKMGRATIKTTSVSYSCTINAGDKYKVRARTIRGKLLSDWSTYSSNVLSKPSAPSKINTIKATSKTSILLEWSKVTTAETYEIEYATKKEYLEGSNGTTTISSITTTRYEITGLEMGNAYFFRLRTANTQGTSGWTSIVSISIGTKPGPPTTWSSTTTAITGEQLILYWLHNTEDNSQEKLAEVEVYYNDVKTVHIVENKDPVEDDKTSQFVIDTSKYVEGSKIKWRVRTSGITNEYGDWSIQRTINVYAPPTLSLSVLDKDLNPFNVLTSFPLFIKAVAGPDTQTPLSYSISIISNDTYETVDEIGNRKNVIAGDEIYNKFFDISEPLAIKITPADIDLHNDMSYTVNAIVAMNSGLTAKDSSIFSVSWTDEVYNPNAEISIDRRTMATNIRPYCTYYPDIYYKVEYTNSKWIKTNEVIQTIDGMSVDNAFTEVEGLVVYAGFLDNVMTHFCIEVSKDEVPIPGITLSVYRREFDGSFIEIGTNLINMNNTYVTDPHPALDFARYRVIAVSDTTGSISYTDIPAIPMNDANVIIQWDEEWRPLEVIDDITEVEPDWAGSMIKIPYNVNVSDSNDSDVTLVNYIGRNNPVSYYGTQLGVKSTWSMAIPKTDVNTLYALRRLAIWMGDVYVREPSGSGYWANIKVTFDQTHNELTIPISMSIVRVEGGV